MAGRAAEVHQAALGEQVDALVAREVIAVVLRLDVLNAHTLGRLELVHLDLIIKVADVTHDGLILELKDVIHGDDVAVAGGGDVDVADAQRAFDGVHLEAFHRGLEGVDRVDLSDDDACAVSPQRVGGTLADITVTADDGHLAGEHDVGGALDAVRKRLAAAVEVVELGLGDRVVHVDGGHEQGAGLLHLVQAVHAGRRLLGDAAPLLDHPGPDAGLLLGEAAEQGLDHGNLVAVVLALIGPLGALLEFIALVDEQRHVTAVVDDQLRSLVAGEQNGLEGQFPILLQGLALPGEHRSSGRGDGRGGVVLGGEDVAGGPADVGAEGDQGLDEHRGLDGHVQRSGDAHALQGLGLRILLPDGDQARHLMLGNGDLLAAPLGQRDVTDDVVRSLRRSRGVGGEVGQGRSHFGDHGGGFNFGFGHKIGFQFLVFSFQQGTANGSGLEASRTVRGIRGQNVRYPSETGIRVAGRRNIGFAVQLRNLWQSEESG